METIEVRFADLRRAAKQVPVFIEKQLGCEAERGLRTSVEDNMGSCGDDTEDLLLSFSKQFSVDVSKFDFTSFISPEPSPDPLTALLSLFLLALFLTAWIVKLFIALLYWTFSPTEAKAFLTEPIGNPFSTIFNTSPKPRQEVLTIGDFVASVAAGHFVKRERVRFVLV